MDVLGSFVSSFGSLASSVFSGILQVAVWILALQGLFLGLMVLFYGRRAFWIFASVVGFVLGLWLASSFNINLPDWAQPLFALALGIGGAAVGYFAPRPVAAIIGSVLLALLGAALLSGFGAATWLQWLVAIALGFVGFYVFWRVLDWALIVGTALFGALLVSASLTSLFGFARGLGILPFLLFLVVGILYQARDRQIAAEFKRLRAKPAPAPAEELAPAPLPAVEQPAELPPPAAVVAAPAAIAAAELSEPATEPEASASTPSAAEAVPESPALTASDDAEPTTDDTEVPLEAEAPGDDVGDGAEQQEG